MFARSSSSLPKPVDVTPASEGPVALNTVKTIKSERPKDSAERPRSVIGNDLKIIGAGLRIVSEGVLQIDGSIEGDVQGAEVIIGEGGQLIGTVAAEQVVVKGAVSGTIRGLQVHLEERSRVEGDIHHHQLVVTNGAQFDGRSRRVAEAAQLAVTLDAVAAGNT
ncbi:MAG: polymer-forming cytoskeletal protein [Hyphomicrobiales bacterium]|nr:polymer-forming cytoskeletal protein [Hyphomicrobiales bacterium]